MSALREDAIRYAEMGYPIFPCVPGEKAPLTQHGFHDATTDIEQIDTWWRKHPLANIATPTRGLLVVDVDGADNPWPDAPERRADLSRGAISNTPRGGQHFIFRQPSGKSWGNTAGGIAPKVDTRCNGGYIVVPPSVVEGKQYRWSEVSTLPSPDELTEPPGWLTALLDRLGGNGSAPGTPEGARRSPQCDDPVPNGNTIPTGQRNDTLARLAGAMRRVGSPQKEILVALAQANQDRCQPPLLESEVERVAASICRYAPDQMAAGAARHHVITHSRDIERLGVTPHEVADPGPLPFELLRVPGFISEVMDHSLETAPYPNVTMAFAGALALQATLAGRKVRDSADVRTNLYLLGLAHSSAGKEHPRKVNNEILHAIGLADHFGGQFASGEGIQDALFAHPSMLFQTDEIDGMLQSINKAKDARYESIMSTLLTVYSAANSVFPMRRKAGKSAPGAIDQPSLVLFGTAIPSHYYGALSERMLTNGFFARMIVLDCGRRGSGQEPLLRPLPERVVAHARWWAEFRPGDGNLKDWRPDPLVVPQTLDASRTLVEIRKEAEMEYDAAVGSSDEAGAAVWGRVGEHARKLALIYAVSECRDCPEIGRAGAEWASRFVVHQARRMLFMAQSHVADSPFDALCLKFLKKLRGAPNMELSHSKLLKRMKTDAKTFASIIDTVEQRGDIVTRADGNRPRAGRFYRLVSGTSE
ncbi:MAG: bifunctional DNA primase/polymerase [Candidatus Eisenbacteria bacterium]